MPGRAAAIFLKSACRVLNIRMSQSSCQVSCTLQTEQRWHASSSSAQVIGVQYLDIEASFCACLYEHDIKLSRLSVTLLN